MVDLINRDFGDYLVMRRIGSGAMAEVYLAEQKSLGRRVALKILKPELAGDEVHLQRFVREARAIARMVHPNLVQIYQADCFDNYWFIAQEYVSGQTLQNLIQTSSPLPAIRIAEILWQVSAALYVAQQAGIVHRDIKPENILIGDDGNVKITDFGLARFNDTGALALTQIGMTLGTPLYMSPEQTQGKPLDHRSDIYSLGITCYHAAASRPPFTGDTAIAVALQHVNSEPTPLKTIRPDLPDLLCRIIHRMIEKDAAERFQSFDEIRIELRTLYSVAMSDYETDFLSSSDGLNFDPIDKKVLERAEKLQSILKQSNDADKKNIHRLRYYLGASLFFVVLILSAVCLGYLHVTMMPNPLHPPTSDTIKKFDTVEEQWVYACILNSPEAWNCVIEYFPDADYFWGRKAKRQLIRYYFYFGERGDPERLLPLFQEFAQLSGVDGEDRALGLVGLAWYNAEIADINDQEKINTASDYLLQFYELNFNCSDPLLIQILDATKKNIQQKASHQKTQTDFSSIYQFRQNCYTPRPF
ncbi:MAG: serine/threonine protein kinase [Planctomycetaceae bacterium]|jgi:serine/threonine-protein kinase|nr:serine/threonine protein kinase [Planctomycetaceae bacterium]